MTVPAAAPFDQIVLPHLDAAYNLARWLARDAVLAKDIVQDAVVRALGYFGTYRGGDARAWFLRIVRNTAYGTLTLRRRTDEASRSIEGGPDNAALQLVDPAAGPEDALSQQERVMQLDQALAALPTELRECLLLRELEELSCRQIAYVTGVPLGTVMSRLWRARRALLPGHPGGPGEGEAP